MASFPAAAQKKRSFVFSLRIPTGSHEQLNNCSLDISQITCVTSFNFTDIDTMHAKGLDFLHS